MTGPAANTAGPYVAALTVYPVKSTAGIEVQSVELDERGVIGDRRWLLVDPDGEAITARVCHAMLGIAPAFHGDDRDGAIRLSAEGMSPMDVAVPAPDAPQRHVEVWGDRVVARDAGDEAAAWCSAVMGRAARLVRIFDDSRRALKPKYAGPLPAVDRDVAFTDGAPLMMLGLPGIAALEVRLAAQGQTLAMDRRRFRANVWLAGLDAHEEDRWRLLRIGDVTFGAGTLCARCVLTTVDPDTRVQGAEPLRTLATYRRVDGLVMFGVNITHASTGSLHVGDRVLVEEWR